MDDHKHVLTVEGMSCEHCVIAVTTEVGAVSGVDTVSVDLKAGIVTVAGGDRPAIEAAIDEAGFDVI
jgi:copper chaperone CopZ